MQFISPLYLCFLPVVLSFYYFTKQTQRWLVLLAASLLFVGLVSPIALLALLFFSILTYYSGILIGQARKYRSFIFFSVLVLQVFCLFLLKYLEAEKGILRLTFREEGYQADLILLVIGFSFYTLQHIAYLADVYFKRIPVCTQPLRFLLFSSFFAKFNSGPLEKAEKLIPQFGHPLMTKALLVQGLQRIVLGFMKKMVLADRLAPVVSQVFSEQTHHGSFSVATAVCLFTVQLYFDFSAYSDIAIGTAKLFGIELSENFNRPFASLSVSEFWRRWHITLISWFSNYIYYPLVYAFRKSRKAAVIAGIFATFLLSGLWHGIGKTFLIWSLLHALYLSFESLTKNTRLNWLQVMPVRAYRIFSMGLTFMLVCFSNLFFRSSGLPQAESLLSQLMTAPLGGDGWMKGFVAVLAGGGYQEAVFNFGLTALLVILFLCTEKHILRGIDSGNKAFVRIFTLLIFIFTCGVFKNAGYFIYLQF